MKLYSIHRVLDGKWEIVLHIRRNDDWQFAYEPRPDIRALVDEHYNVTPDVMARMLMDSVLHCEAVEISTMSGQGIVMRKADDQASEGSI
jgi:hypothetical protein